MSASTERLEAFEKHLVDYCSDRHLHARRWPGAAKRTANVQEIRSEPPILIYVKDSALKDNVFWGLSESQLQALRDSGNDWWVVLLHGAGEASHVISREVVDKATRTHRWSQDRNAAWKIHLEKSDDLAGSKRFYDFDELFAALLKRSA